MPEIKRIPQEGKMNIDLNDRILPPGQYREALNVNVGRSETSEVGTVENLLGNRLVEDIGLSPGAECIGSYRDNGNERIFFLVTTNDSFDQSEGGEHGIYQYDQISENIIPLVTSSVLNFHKDFPVTGLSLIEDLLFFTDDRNEPRKINIDRARNNPDYYNSNLLLSVAKPAPFQAASIINAINDPIGVTSTFLQDRLPRFTYRWRFDDGEYSVLAPFTPIIFNTNLTSVPITDTSEAVTTGAVSEFINNVNSITLTAPITTNAGITSVEFIYSDTSNTNTYILEDIPVTSESSVGYTYESQDPFRTLPGSQVTRVFDAVPRRAKSQEIAGGRIVYGNYLQNYNLPDVDFSVDSAVVAGNSQLPNQFAKSNRTYEVGIVLSDESGRTTPVILSNSGQGTVFVGNTGEKLRINFEDTTQLDGFHSYKVVVKQRQQEYYNLFTDGTSRFGDNASKVPIDFTAIGDETGNMVIRPSSRSIYANGNLSKVTINENGLIQMPNITSAGTFEVEPVESEIDIFWESSTGGLVSQITSGSDILIDYYNCYLISGIEANRIRMGFNDPAWDFGVRAHQVDEEFAGEERRANTLIHSSGFFNSRTGLNQLNQFNEAEGGITLSLDPSDGSIQLLYAEDTQLIIWQEDKVSRSPIDKDFIYSAEGGAVPVTSNTQYLGTIAPYAGEYGISTDPQSFAVYGTTKYFTDRNRGVVLRLSQDGLTEISRAGLSDFLRDALRASTSVIGSFNEYHNVYNLTIIGEAYDSSEDTNRATATDGYFTIGYEEDTRGWVSFKSFQQESGTTLNNRYYTFNGGNLWEHNDPTEGRRNNFYNNGPAESYIDFILNDSPSAIKTFNTIGYEGTDGWICDFIDTDIDAIGDPPEVTEGFVSSRLIVDSSTAENTRFSGERTNRVIGGNPTQWVVQVSPISFQYVLDDLNQVDLTILDPGISIINKTLNEGSIYFLLEADSASEFTYRVSLEGDGADLAFQVTLLTLNITGTSVSDENVGLSRISIGLNDGGNVVSEEVDIIALGNYYLDENDVSVNTDQISSFISSPVEINNSTANADDVVVTIPVAVPVTAAGTFPITIDATPRIKPILRWNIPLTPIVGYELPPVTSSPLGPDIYVSPRDEDSVRTNDIELTLLQSDETTHIILDSDITISVDPLEGSISVPLVINNDRSFASFSVLSTIDLSDITTNVDITASTTEAILTISDDTAETLPDFTAQTSTERTVTTNVDNKLVESGETWATPSLGLGPPMTVSVAVDRNLEFEARTVTVTITPQIVRLTGVTPISFTVTQPTGFALSSTSETVAAGGSATVTLTFPNDFASVSSEVLDSVGNVETDISVAGGGITSPDANTSQAPFFISVDSTVAAGDYTVRFIPQGITDSIDLTLTVT